MKQSQSYKTEGVHRGRRLTSLYKFLFIAICTAGKPLGGIARQSVYHWLARKAYLVPEFKPHKDKWGNEFFLSPYLFIDRHIIAFGYYDLNLDLCLQGNVKPGMVTMDIGANIGTVTIHMAKLVKSYGVVHAFEPVPPILERLNGHVKLNKMEDVVRIHPIALSNGIGKMEVVYADEMTENQGMGSIANTDNEVVSLRCEIPTTTIDDFVRKNGVSHIDFIKIDIQGAETLLLEGGKDVFGRMSLDLLIEVSPSDLCFISKNSVDLMQMLSAFGYHMYEIEGGRPSKKINIEKTEPEWAADNIFCTKKQITSP